MRGYTYTTITHSKSKTIPVKRSQLIMQVKKYVINHKKKRIQRISQGYDTASKSQYQRCHLHFARSFPPVGCEDRWGEEIRHKHRKGFVSVLTARANFIWGLKSPGSDQKKVTTAAKGITAQPSAGLQLDCWESNLWWL